MALQEGRCTNCGSILILDPEQEKGHCLYCDAVFDNATAFELYKDAGDYTFPNLPQPKYEGPSLDPVPSRSHVHLSAPKKAASSEAAADPAPAYVRSATKVPSLDLGPRKILLLALLFAGVILLTLVLCLPFTLHRDRYRLAIAEDFAARDDIELKLGENFNIQNLNNNEVYLALPKAIEQKEAEKLFEDYCSSRAKAMALSENDAGRKDVKLHIATPQGGWNISGQDGSAELKLEELPYREVTPSTAPADEKSPEESRDNNEMTEATETTEASAARASE